MEINLYELYFERLEKAGLGKIKRPDILVFKREDEKLVMKAIEYLGGISELPFNQENTPHIKNILSKAIVGIECENSYSYLACILRYGIWYFF